MGSGVYGSYLRTYVPAAAQLRQVSLNGEPAGVEQTGIEFGKAVFGRFFAVLPDETAQVEFSYETPDVVVALGERVYEYSLLLQKQPGTLALPLTVEIDLPRGAELISTTLDGEPLPGLIVTTDLRTDRELQVRFRLP
jgi:hypothetical protein